MDFEFRFTKDNSVGLYNFDVDDIYHSSYGAKTEAFEKFILPLNFKKNFSHKNNLNILDICYGIGYNTKALLDYLKKINYEGQLHIDILENDKRLVALSPYIKDGLYNNCPELSYILVQNLGDLVFDNEALDIMLNVKNKPYFIRDYLDFIKKVFRSGYVYNPERKINAFLHNIYYHSISPRIKKAQKSLKKRNITITPYIDDARNSVLKLNNRYDIVFLDAFTPAKLPTLWSFEFLSKIYELMNTDSMLLTYSNSAAIRHALFDIGFNVGKLFDKKNRSCGTVASKNEFFIMNKLDDYDIGLMQTNAGVYFKDASLNATAEEILNEHKLRKELLNLESSSSYIKRNKNNRGNLNE